MLTAAQTSLSSFAPGLRRSKSQVKTLYGPTLLQSFPPIFLAHMSCNTTERQKKILNKCYLHVRDINYEGKHVQHIPEEQGIWGECCTIDWVAGLKVG